MTDKLEQNAIGERLSICRQNKKMTQEELAGRLGVTPQALSKWERGISLPDVLMLSDLAKILGISTDYLLGTENRIPVENGDGQAQSEIWRNLRNSLEPLELVFGKMFLPIFLDDPYKDKIVEVRKKLSAEGILMPTVRVRDELSLQEDEFMILSCQNILSHSKLEKLDANTLDHILSRLEEAVRNKYFEILSPDLIKKLTDNLKIKYPALIEGIVPDKITYGLLTNVSKLLLQKGISIRFLPKIIEIMDCELSCNRDITVSGLADRAAEKLERSDCFLRGMETFGA